MKSIVFILTLAAMPGGGAAAWACPRCRPFVNAGVYNPHFGGHLLVMLLPIAVIFAIGFGLYWIDLPSKSARS